MSKTGALPTEAEDKMGLEAWVQRFFPHIFSVKKTAEKVARSFVFEVHCRTCKTKPFRNVGEGKKLCYRHLTGRDHTALYNEAMDAALVPGTKEAAQLALVLGTEDAAVVPSVKMFRCACSLSFHRNRFKQALVSFCGLGTFEGHTYTYTYTYTYTHTYTYKYIYIYIYIHIT